MEGLGRVKGRGIVEGAKGVEVGSAVGGLAEGQSRSSAAAERDVMGVAGIDWEEELLARVDH